MKKVLIVIDMQNDFITGPLGTPEAQTIVPNVVEKVSSFSGDDIYFTQDTHLPDYLFTLEGKYLPVEHCIAKSAGWCIIPELSNISVPKEYINKLTFGYADWEDEFNSDEVEFELCGVCTDICVVSNALALRMFYPNSRIIVDASCCAGSTVEKHKAALEVMKSCQIEVIGE